MLAAQIGEWPIWTRVLILGVLALVSIAVWRLSPDTISNQRKAEHIEEPAEYRQIITGEILLPSSVPGYHFRFSATVLWRPTVAEHHDFSSLAVGDILNRARSIIGSESPALCTLLAKQLEAALAIPGRCRSGRVEAMARDVSLTLPDDDLKRLAELTDLDKQAQLWEYQRRHEKSQRDYLGEDVFKSPGRAVIWWLISKEAGVTQAESLLGTLARLSAAVNGDEELLQRLLGHDDVHLHDHLTASEHLRKLMEQVDLFPDSDEGQQFVDRVARCLESAGRAQEAAEILREFGLEPLFSPRDEGSQGPGD
ncbi:hypothetical protein [Microbispora rosea]